MTNDTIGRPSTPALFADAMAKMTTLFETELRLVKTEIGEKISTAIHAVIVIAVAAVLMLAALILLLIGAVEVLIAFGMVRWAAYVLVGVVIALIGGVALYIASRQLSSDKLMPSRTFDQLGKDADALKEQVR